MTDALTLSPDLFTVELFNHFRQRYYSWTYWNLHPVAFTARRPMFALIHGSLNEDQLVPFTKAYSGLTDDEIREVDRWIRQYTIERFGPVRSVKPNLYLKLRLKASQNPPAINQG